jgi:hypothetical protein
VEDVAFQQSLTAERRFGVSDEDTDVAATSNYGAIRPNQLRDLDLKDNQELVEGTISRWRFQAGRLRISPNTLEGDRVAFTNDPFTPAQSWLDSEDVVITLKPNGDTEVKAGRNLLKLEDQLAIPVTRQTEFKKEEEVTNRWVLGFDEEDRDGFFVGYNIPIRFGEKGRLTLQPQFNLERAYRTKPTAIPYRERPSALPIRNSPSPAATCSACSPGWRPPWRVSRPPPTSTSPRSIPTTFPMAPAAGATWVAFWISP